MLNKNKYIVALLALTAGCTPAAYAVDVDAANGNLHALITREALQSTLGAANLQAVIAANVAQDFDAEAVNEKRRHFDGGNIASTLSYINREKTKTLNLAAEADTDLESRADALRHLGILLHSIQDFYLRSNYVELQLEDKANRSDPYNIPLVDWVRIPTGYIGEASGKPLTAAKHGDIEDLLNKDSDTTPGGKIVVSGKATNYSVARELAVRETQRQWNLFETLVRNRCGSRSAAILAALRQAPSSAKSGASAVNGVENNDYQ